MLLCTGKCPLTAPLNHPHIRPSIHLLHLSPTSFLGDTGEAEPVEGTAPVQGTDGDLMDGETEGDTVVIAGQPEVLSTQEMQVPLLWFCHNVTL